LAPHFLSITRCLFHIAALLGLGYTASSAAKSSEFMPPEELRRGMRGFGLSVFQGTQIDTFGVEILGVIKGRIGPGHDLILARFSGANLEHTGIIRGMSGSPVYIENRLVGAVAYGWSYSKDPIGGITPIAPMVDVTQRSLDPGNAEKLHQSLHFSPAQLMGDPAKPDRATLERLTTPVALSGFGGLAQSTLSEMLAPLGLDVMQGPGNGRAEDREIAIVPGAGLGVQLISGDRNATAIGTLTWTDGDRFVGFGHPMLHVGATDMPATSVYIHQVIPTQTNSFKLGSPVRPFGAVRQDRQPGIGGLIGSTPSMVPVSVELSSRDGKKHFNFEVMRHRDLLPVLVRSTLISAMEAGEKLSGDAALVLRGEITLHDGRRVKYEQFYSGPSAALIASLEAVQPLAAIARSSFPNLEIAAVDFSAELREGLAQARIIGMRLPAETLRPDRSYALEITLAPYEAESVRQKVDITLPVGTPPGLLLIRVSSGKTSRFWESSRRPDAFVARNAEQLLQLLEQPGRADQLVIEVLRAKPGLTIDGREMPSLPPSARAVLKSSPSSGHLGPVTDEVLLRLRLPTPYLLSGEQFIETMLENH
jgi:hypothetical protein